MAENLFKKLQDKAQRLGERAISGITKGDDRADEALLSALKSVRGGRRLLNEHRAQVLGAVGQATDQTEIGDFNPHVRALPAVNPYYPSLHVARANGITTVLTAQSSGIIRGTGSVIQFNDGDTWEKVAVVPEAALRVAAGLAREN